MRLETIVFLKVLMCLYICICNGAPPKEDGTGSFNTKFKKYTIQEDKFLVEEVTRLVEVPHSNNIWKKVTERHNERWTAGTEGFPQERSVASIRSRFWDVLMYNDQHAEVNVPEILREKLLKTNSNQKARGASLTKERSSEKGTYTGYDKREDDFILDELRKPYCTKMLGPSTMEMIRKEHDRKRRAGIDGFETERTAESLRMRVMRLRQKGLLPRDILEKFSSKQPVRPRHSYTAEEDKFILEALSKQSQYTLFSKSAVESIRAELDQKRKAKIPGFENERTAGSLASHIVVMRKKGLLPGELAENYTERLRALSNAVGTSSGEPSSTHPNQQSDFQIAGMTTELNEEETAEWIDQLFDDTEFQFVFNEHY